jgi:hypothetical protein
VGNDKKLPRRLLEEAAESPLLQWLLNAQQFLALIVVEVVRVVVVIVVVVKVCILKIVLDPMRYSIISSLRVNRVSAR